MDELELLVQAILSLKDTTKSKEQILSELPKLEKKLQSDEKARIEIIAGLEVDKSKDLIKSQLKDIASRAKAPTIKVGVDVCGCNKQSVSKTIANDLKTIPSVSKTVSDTMIRNFKDSFGMAKKLSQETKTEIKSTLQDISSAWDTGNAEKYYASIAKIMGLIEKNSTSFISPDQQKAIQDLRNVMSDGSKVFVDDKLHEQLKCNIEDATELKRVLDNVYGAGKWTYDRNKSSVSADSIIDPNFEDRFNSVGEAILYVNNQIKNLQNTAKTTTLDEMIKMSSESEVQSQIENLIQSVLRLDSAVQQTSTHSNSFFDGFEVIGEIEIDPEQQAQLKQFLEKEVKLLNDILDTKTKIAKIKDDPNKSSELEAQKSILSKYREKLVLLRSENSEISKLVSQQVQNEYIIENTSKSRERLKVAEARAADKLVKSEKELAQQSEKTLAIEIKKSAQLERQIDTLKSQIATYKSSNPRAVKDYDNEFNVLIQDLDSAKTKEDVAKVRTEFETLKSEIKAAGKEGKTFWQTIKDSAEKFSSWMTLTSIISTVARDIKKMVTNVIELDSAMTNLKKVTDETESTYNRFLKNTAQQAKELHSTITDLIEQTSTWAKLGFNLSQSNVLAKASMIYSNVGEVDNEQAVTNIVSALKAFDIAAEDVMKIPDVYNKLGNEFAVSSKNLGSGISQAATTMAQARNNFGQVAAILTGAGEILGDNKMEEIGNGMKTVTLRIQNQAGALKELGEEYEDLISVSKTQQQIFELTNGAVNIMQDSDPNSFRSTYDILSDVAEVIKDLNDVQASELIQLLFGKNRANVGTAVLKAFQSGQIQKAYEAAENSAGSAQKEFDKWSESIEAHINTMKSSFESLSATVINSDLIKGGVDFLTNITNGLDFVIDKLGVIPTLISAITLGTSLKNVGELNQNTPVYALSLTKCA